MRRVKSATTQLIDAMRGKGAAARYLGEGKVVDGGCVPAAAVRYLVEGAGRRQPSCPGGGD